MTRTLLVAGTASHVGKSTVAAGLCRLLADRGVSVAPYKAQNMSNNARAVPRAGTADPAERPAGTAFGEIGISQYVQACAARVPPSTDHNPVLLKPRGNGESQVVLQGIAESHESPRDYYDDHWTEARTAARQSFDRLAEAHEVIVAEGAGSIAEVNLHDRDLANVETARFALDREGTDLDVVLVADIERGGMFASVVGTLALLPEDLREHVAGVVVTKFRGDRSVLADGLAWLESETGVPVLGVLPYDDPGLPEEDSVALPGTDERLVLGGDDGVTEARAVTVAVPRLPRVSNATDLEPLARVPGVRVRWQPLGDGLADADGVILPGTKNTVDDCLRARTAGLGERLAAFEGPIVGLCGGYQLLGERIRRAAVEGTGDRETVEAFGLLPVETVFSADKRVLTTDRELASGDDGVLAGATGRVQGYEIHMGDTRLVPGTDPADVARPLGGDSVVVGSVLGTYLHGLFENEAARDGFVDAVFAAAGLDRPAESPDAAGEDPYEAAAALLGDHLDLSPLGLPGRASDPGSETARSGTEVRR